MLIYAIILLNVIYTLSDGQNDTDTKYKIVCYLGSWANYRYGPGKFLIEDIDPFLCTHLVYGFAKLSNNRITAYDPYLDLKENWGLGAFQRFNNLRKTNTELKTLLAIGGWNEGSTKYSKMARTSQSREIFINSSIEFLKKYEFDGLDLDWEYPANRGGVSEDKKNFVTLLKEMKQEFEKNNLLLTAAVSAGKNTIDTAYDIPAVSRYLDFINLMTYDFHGGWDKYTGINAPLFPRPDEPENQKTLNVDFAVNYWLKKGAPADKIIMGMPLYGRSFTLQNPRNHGLGATITGKGPAGPYTREPGFLGYNELCSKLKAEKNWTVVFDDHHKTPYAFKGREWIGFDNEKSIGIKVEYIKSKGLGGGMVWSIETDDFKDYCKNGRYPLISIIKKQLNEKVQRRSTIDAATEISTEIITGQSSEKTSYTTSTETASAAINTSREAKKEETSTTAVYSTIEMKASSLVLSTEDASSSEEICKEEGYFRNPKDCKKFYYCKAKEESGFYIYDYNCGPGTLYSQAINGCAFPYDVPECNSS